MLKDILRWAYWYPFRYLAQALPFGFLLASGRLAGDFLYRFSNKKRAPLEMAGAPFGFDKPEHVKRALEIFIQNEFEALIYPKLNTGNIEKLVEIEGLANLDAALEKGKGAMLIFAHFGANQMIMPAIGYRGYKMSQLSAPYTVWQEKWPTARKPSRMRDLGHKMRWEMEKSLPVRHINIFGSLKEAFACLKRNEILGVAMDGGGGKERAEITFLGKKGYFSTGSMDIAMRTGCAALPVFMLRQGNGRHKMVIEPALEMAAGGEKEMELRENIRRFVGRLEEYVLKYPSHYLSFLAFRKFMQDHGDAPFIL